MGADAARRGRFALQRRTPPAFSNIKFSRKKRNIKTLFYFLYLCRPPVNQRGFAKNIPLTTIEEKEGKPPTIRTAENHLFIATLSCPFFLNFKLCFIFACVFSSFCCARVIDGVDSLIRRSVESCPLNMPSYNCYHAQQKGNSQQTPPPTPTQLQARKRTK